MRELLILCYALALVLIAAGSPTDRGECCLEKTVGGVTYIFVEKGDTAAYSCLSDCVYRKKGELGPKICFAKGEEKVQCEDSEPTVMTTENLLGLCPSPKVGYRIVLTNYQHYYGQIENINDCSDKCAHDNTCVAWTWRTDLSCFTYNSSPNRITVAPYPEWTSGQKATCPPSPPSPPPVSWIDMSYPDGRICDDDLKSFLSATNNSILTIKCCNPSANISTCVGLDCLTKCGGNITCMIPVLNLENFTECKTTDLGLAVTKPTCKGFGDNANKGMETKYCPSRYTDVKCACCKYSPEYNACSLYCRCNGICSYFKSIGFNTDLISWCQSCPEVLEYTTNSMDTTDLASPSIPYNFPTTSYSYSDYDYEMFNSQTSAVDCMMCENKKYADDNEDACKCDCTCKYITGCTGYDAADQWSQCWTDYSFCCECSTDAQKAAGQYYGTPCPGTCKDVLDGDSNAYDLPVQNSLKLQDHTINCTYR